MVLEIVFRESRLQASDLLSIGYLFVLKAHSAVDLDLALGVSSKQDGQRFSELNGSLWGVDLLTIGIQVEITDHGAKVVTEKIPDFNSTIFSDTSEH